MWEWLKSKSTIILAAIVTASFLFFAYSCEPKVPSLWREGKQINRQELQLELDQLISVAQLRMVDLEKQEQLRTIILQNALILVQGQPFNPAGLITAVAALYGIGQASKNVSKTVKTVRIKRKENNANT